MDIVFILLPASLFLALLALWGFFWATRSGQFDDLDTPQLRILQEEEIDNPRDTDHE